MSRPSCPLAIVGISCLFPKADDLQAYWANIKNGVNAITPLPAGSHWNAADYFDADPKSPDRTYAQRGGFISPVNFNPMEFGIAPKDIEATDTTQLLSLVAAHQALADAGYGSGRDFDRSRTSVILGVTGALELVIPLGARLGHPIWRKALRDAGVTSDVADDVVQRIADSYVGWQENSFPGLLGNVAAGRIASRLNLGGTNCVVDAACASSLAAIHLAGLELAAGRSDMVITGGVDTFNDIFMYMCFSKTPALSPTGDAKPFDRDCDGTVLGEGLGVLVLKRLADAESSGDRIYAVLKGMGSSSDGRSSAIYAPRAEGQKLAMQRAYEFAGVTPESIGLIEAHGTGTKVGDATELASLTEVFQTAEPARSWCALGSVKSQIGHTKAAAGVAGLIKATLALHQKVLPPTIKVTQPIDAAAPGRSPFYVNTRKRPWLSSGQHPRRAGVSAFGFGGTNFHCVLEEHGSAKPAVDWDGDVEILAFSSARLDELKAQIASHATDTDWPAFRRAAHASRRQFERAAQFRLLFVVTRDSDRVSLKDAALTMLEKNPDRSAWTAPAGIAFGSGATHGKLAALFPGQGSQYVGMLRDLACQFPEMMNALTAADGIFAREHSGPGPQRLSDFIYPHPAFSEQARLEQEEALKATDVAQPALGAVSLGAFNVLHYFGVAAQAACGHSYGELLALCGAGRITPDALHQLSNLRGRLMAKKPGSSDRGAMLAVQAAEEAVRGFLHEAGGDLVVANRNSPKQFVLAGTAQSIEQAAGELTRRAIRTRVLPVSAAFHSPLVADAHAPFAKALESVAFGNGEIPVYANSTGQEYPQPAGEARALLANQIVRPVNFMAQVQAMYADGVRTFIEVGPGHVLGDLVQSILPGCDVETIALDASRGTRSGTFDLALALSRLATLGHEVNFTRWENAPAPLAAISAKPALTVAISGANYRAPHAPRPPVTVQPIAVATLRASDRALPGTSHRPHVPSDMPGVAPAIATPGSVLPVFAPTQPQDIPAALHVAQKSILALQQLQEQTAQLHRQFLEGQESARRTIQSLLESRSSAAIMPAAAASVAHAPVAPAPAPEREHRTAVPPAAAGVTPRGGQETPRVPVAASAEPAALADRSRIERAVLETVSEKTGYPVEMLALGMGLDSDLGIDSIKRVEIMAALRGRLPQAPEVKPEHLGALQTLEQVVAFLAGGARPQAAPANAHAAPAASSIGTVLLEVVAEKTGYPVEMLNLTMSMDSDLGIDSIKRVEIMAALRGRLPGAPEVKPEHLGALQTLAQVVAFLGDGAHAATGDVLATTAIAVACAAPSDAAVSAALLTVVAEKTGYPVEMLNLGMSMDSDLGIDSIKRVEIMAAMRARLPAAPEIKPEHLGALQSLQQVVDFLVGSPAIAAIGARAPDAAPVPAAVQPAAQSDLLRQIVRPVELARDDGRDTIALARGARVWLCDDGSALGARVEEQLRAMHLTVHRRDLSEPWSLADAGSPAALVILTSSGGSPDTFLNDAFRLIQTAGPALRRAGKQNAAILVTVSRLDGAFGFGDLSAAGDPVSGGLAGLVKTARREWPEVHCKALDVNPAALQADVAAAFICDEMFRAGPVEVGLCGYTRVGLEIDLAPAVSAAGHAPLSEGDVVIVSGGARGITGDTTLALARAFRPTLVLLGRTEPSDREPVWLQNLHTEPEIKKAFFTRLHGDRSPKVVEIEYRDVLARREIRAQLARLEATGARAVYRCVDVRDGAAVAHALTEIRQQYGAIRGLIHGAGVLADRRIEDKTAEQFDRVYRTKVAGLQNLLAGLAHEPLQVIALFASFSGRYGRIGQADYAAANEVLNKVAQVESRRRPACRVLSVNWGPWNGGMATPALRALFAQENVGLIEPAAGADFLVREMCAAEKGPVEVLVLAPPPQPVPQPEPAILMPHRAAVASTPVAFEREVSVAALPCLESHVFNDRAVLPAALMVEWLAQAALHGNPGMAFHGLDNFKVLKGVVLEGRQSITVSLHAGAAALRGNLTSVPVSMTSNAGGRSMLHAQADVMLTAEKLPIAPARALDEISGGGFSDAYTRGVLFHGAALQGIERVEGCAKEGVSAFVRAAPAPRKWMQNPLRGSWIADPLALDSAFQMMILWSTAHRGAPLLPSALTRYRQFVAAFPKGGCRVVIAVALGITALAVSSIEFLDRQGNLLASAEGCECVVDAGLRDAFRLNRLKLER